MQYRPLAKQPQRRRARRLGKRPAVRPVWANQRLPPASSPNIFDLGCCSITTRQISLSFAMRRTFARTDFGPAKSLESIENVLKPIIDIMNGVTLALFQIEQNHNLERFL